jgi:5-methylcytosine-specific restriction protein A
MQFTGGNRAIRNHVEDGKDLLLFESLGKGEGYRYVGPFSCASWEHGAGQDVDNAKRSTIVFHLVRCEEMAVPAPAESATTTTANLAKLRLLAMAAAKPIAGTRQGAGRSYRERSDAVRKYVLARACGKCECCGNEAPFVRANGEPYLEPHHIHRLADDGPDAPQYVAAICPTCHRRIHYGSDGASINIGLAKQIVEMETSQDGLSPDGPKVAVSAQG